MQKNEQLELEVEAPKSPLGTSCLCLRYSGPEVQWSIFRREETVKFHYNPDSVQRSPKRVIENLSLTRCFLWHHNQHYFHDIIIFKPTDSGFTGTPHNRHRTHSFL